MVAPGVASAKRIGHSKCPLIVIFCLRIVQPGMHAKDNRSMIMALSFMAQQKLCKAIYRIKKFAKHVGEQPAFPSHFLSRWSSIFNRPTGSVGLLNQNLDIAILLLNKQMIDQLIIYYEQPWLCQVKILIKEAPYCVLGLYILIWSI